MGIQRIRWGCHLSAPLPGPGSCRFPDPPQFWVIVISNHSDQKVISPFLIILRVANQTALTTDTIATGNIKIDPLHFMSHGGSNGQDAPSEGYPVTGIHTSEESSGERDVRVETTFDEVRLSQGSSDPQRVT